MSSWYYGSSGVPNPGYTVSPGGGTSAPVPHDHWKGEQLRHAEHNAQIGEGKYLCARCGSYSVDVECRTCRRIYCHSCADHLHQAGEWAGHNLRSFDPEYEASKRAHKRGTKYDSVAPSPAILNPGEPLSQLPLQSVQGLLLTLVAFLLVLIALLTPSFAVCHHKSRPLDGDDPLWAIGVFRTCWDKRCEGTLYFWEDIPCPYNKFQVSVNLTRVFLICGLAFNFFTLLFMMLAHKGKWRKLVCLKTGGLCGFLAAIMYILALSLWIYTIIGDVDCNDDDFFGVSTDINVDINVSNPFDDEDSNNIEVDTEDDSASANLPERLWPLNVYAPPGHCNFSYGFYMAWLAAALSFIAGAALFDWWRGLKTMVKFGVTLLLVIIQALVIVALCTNYWSTGDLGERFPVPNAHLPGATSTSPLPFIDPDPNDDDNFMFLPYAYGGNTRVGDPDPTDDDAAIGIVLPTVTTNKANVASKKVEPNKTTKVKIETQEHKEEQADDHPWATVDTHSRAGKYYTLQHYGARAHDSVKPHPRRGRRLHQTTDDDGDTDDDTLDIDLDPTDDDAASEAASEAASAADEDDDVVSFIGDVFGDDEADSWTGLWRTCMSTSNQYFEHWCWPVGNWFKNDIDCIDGTAFKAMRGMLIAGLLISPLILFTIFYAHAFRKPKSTKVGALIAFIMFLLFLIVLIMWVVQQGKDADCNFLASFNNSGFPWGSDFKLAWSWILLLVAVIFSLVLTVLMAIIRVGFEDREYLDDYSKKKFSRKAKPIDVMPGRSNTFGRFSPTIGRGSLAKGALDAAF
eukprot:TRINITY_DN62007_c0_g1_i1.p1 TRINITY_DN62007_c0_g1~~TRINITY_DN62007_c0_g1_i1.p1  ORF type:complete len:797 (-),score=117.88 TRINITY_DN62007_c0_g1_i1:2381-4771(-)